MYQLLERSRYNPYLVGLPLSYKAETAYAKQYLALKYDSTVNLGRLKACIQYSVEQIITFY